jgi:hypothetical protein
VGLVAVELLLCLHHVHMVVLVHLVELKLGAVRRNLLGMRLGCVLDGRRLELLRDELLAVEV